MYSAHPLRIEHRLSVLETLFLPKDRCIRRIRDLNPKDFYIQTVFKTVSSSSQIHA
nr:MAG TPA: hypothetical protein [Caudoviricetes sp.]